jgi:hypothetical protein
MADAMELSKQVYDICVNIEDPSAELKVFLETHPQVSVNQYRGAHDRPALHVALWRGHAACVRMLLQHGADVHAKDDDDVSAMIIACDSLKNEASAECMQLLIDAKADVNAANCDQSAPIHFCYRRHKELKLLLDNGANVNAHDIGDETAAMSACSWGILPCLQLLIDSKADLNFRGDDGQDALHEAIEINYPDKCLSTSFAVLCCNTDAKNVKIDVYGVTAAQVAACIEEYQHIQAYIDEYHSILNKTLSTMVEVDTRVGLGEHGIYQEPLERTLEYLGLSMHKDQVVNASIDGEGGKRALVPFHVLNAEVWYNKYQGR